MIEPSAPKFSPLAFLVDPGSQFPHLVARPTFVLPMLVLLAGTLGLSTFYYTHVDYRWLQDTLLAAHPGLASLAHGASVELDPSMVRAPAVVSTALGCLAGWLAVALYIHFLGAMARRPLRFKLALGIAAWVHVPFIVALLPSAINVANHPEGRLAPDQIDPATVAGLLGSPHAPFWRSLAQAASLDYLWACTLLVIGLRAALALSPRKALACVALPASLIKLGAALALAASAGAS